MATVYASGDELAGRVRVERFLHIGEHWLTYKAKWISTGEAIVLKQRLAASVPTPSYPSANMNGATASIVLECGHTPHVLERFVHKGEVFHVLESLDGRELADMLDAENGSLAAELLRQVIRQCPNGRRSMHSSNASISCSGFRTFIGSEDGYIYVSDRKPCVGMDERVPDGAALYGRTSPLNSPSKTTRQ